MRPTPETSESAPPGPERFEESPDAWANPAVVLVRPREEGNVGAAARAMANMGLARLILVEPAAPLGAPAQAMAVGARSILERCERSASLEAALAPFRRVVATSSTRDRRPRPPWLAPRDLPAALAADPLATPTAIVFGPEVGGLRNEELALASLLVSVPCAPQQPTLNLAQAVLIVAYELYLARLVPLPQPAAMEGRSAGEAAPAAPQAHLAEGPPATTAELDGLFGHLRELLGRIGFERDSTFPGVLRDLRQLASRAAPASREVSILRGICRRALRALERGP